jgi:putative PEP-CTERM system histidine kinase
MMSPPSPALVAPLRCQDLTIGVVLLGPASSPYTDEDVDFVATVVQHAAGAIAVARLSESTAQARQAETFDRVTAFVVHDLKNSVAALSLLARNAVRHFDDPEFQRDTVTSLSQTVARMQRLLARLSSPGPALETLDIEAVEVGVLVAEVTAPLAGDPLVHLERDVATPVVVAADRRALRRVLENLITNAAEAIPRDGSIRVSVTEDDGHAVIAVEDTGCGISEDFLQRHLFTPFRSTKAGGWGIGLYHTKQLVDRHRGEIRVESIEGRGTTFWVKWPRWPKPETTPPGAVSGTRVWETV